MKKISKRVNEIIDKGEEGDIVSKIYDILSVVLILLSVGFILLETFALPAWLHNTLYGFEVGIACLFAVEYVLRVWTAPYEYPELRPDKARMVYIFSFMSLVDLLSIIPVFVANLPTASGILKIFKLCKILRLVKASRYLSGIANFGLAIKKKKKQIIMSIIAMVVLVMICSVLLYSVEHDAQPEVFKNAFSGVWYSLQTIFESDAEIALTTPAGQALSTMMLLIGGCMIGVPIAIIATGFEDMIAEQAGEAIEDKDLYEVLRGYDKLTETEKERFQRIVQIEQAEENKAE
jgi:voltage-gated potassium channel